MWIGADPGGRNNFGLAFLDVNGTAFCQTVSSANQAADAIDFTPNGVGIDAPLWWSAGIGGGAMQTAGFEGPTVSPQELCKQPTP